MKKCPLWLLALILLMSAMPRPVFAQNPVVVKAQLVKAYAQLSLDFQQRNLQAIADLTAPGYVALAPNEPPVDRDSMLKDFKFQMEMMKNPVWKRTIQKLVMKNGQAVVLVDGHLTATTVDVAHKPHAFTLNALSIDIWVPINGKWEVLHSEVLKVQALMDGKPIAAH